MLIVSSPDKNLLHFPAPPFNKFHTRLFPSSQLQLAYVSSCMLFFFFFLPQTAVFHSDELLFPDRAPGSAEDVRDVLSLILSLAQITDLQRSANNSANFPH